MNAPAEKLPAARMVDWSPEQYHAQNRVSNSRLNDFRKSRRRYHGLHVAKTIEPKEQTPAMVLGSLVDDMLFLPDDDRFVVAPEINKRTKAGKAEWASLVAIAEQSGQYIVTQDQYGQAASMVEALLTSKHAGPLLELDGPAQQALIWDDAETGLPCRALLDKLVTEMDLIVDLKTTTDITPDKWSRKMVDFSYHCQAAWYLEAVSLATGKPHGFAHVVVSTVEPYEVAVYEMDMRAVEFGHRLNREALIELAKCIESDEWLSPYEQKPQVIDLPHWAYPREEVA